MILKKFKVTKAEQKSKWGAGPLYKMQVAIKLALDVDSMNKTRIVIETSPLPTVLINLLWKLCCEY